VRAAVIGREAAAKVVEQVEQVTIRFAGDSGDGMQVTGGQFTSTSALVGNDLATFPDFPAEIRADLFRPFRTTKARGTGLGMATAKRLIESQGGTIAVDTPAAGGTTITLTIPVAPADALR